MGLFLFLGFVALFFCFQWFVAQDFSVCFASGRCALSLCFILTDLVLHGRCVHRRISTFEHDDDVSNLSLYICSATSSFGFVALFFCFQWFVVQDFFVCFASGRSTLLLCFILADFVLHGRYVHRRISTFHHDDMSMCQCDNMFTSRKDTTPINEHR